MSVHDIADVARNGRRIEPRGRSRRSEDGATDEQPMRATPTPKATGRGGPQRRRRARRRNPRPRPRRGRQRGRIPPMRRPANSRRKPISPIPNEGRSAPAADAGARRPARLRLQGLHHRSSTRSSRPRTCATPRSSTGCAPISTSSSQSLVGRVAPRQPAAAAPDGAAEPLLGVRSRRGHARSGAARPRRHRSACSRCPSSRRRTPISATPS